MRHKKPVAQKLKPPMSKSCFRSDEYWPGKLSYGSTTWGLWWHGNGVYFRNKITYINSQR